MLGSQISMIGLILFLFQDTHSPAMLALLVALQTLPGCIVAPFAGLVVDRWSKRRTMVLSDVARFFLILLILPFPKPAVILCLTALQSIANMFFGPAKSATFPLIMSTEDLPGANAWDHGAANAVLVAGPVLGSELFLNYGITATLAVDALSFLVSAALIVSMRFQEDRALVAAVGEKWSAVQKIVDGCRYLVSNRTVLQLICLFFVSLLCVGFWLPLAPFFIREFLRGPDRLLGTQTGVFGLGSILGAISAPFWVGKVGKGTMLFFALIGEGLVFTLYSLVPNPVVSILICLVWGVLVAWIVVPYNAMVQELVDRDYLGRIFAVARQTEGLALLLAMACAIVLSRQLSAERIFTIAGLLYLLMVATSILTEGGRQLLRTH
jgi:MFS family permease